MPLIRFRPRRGTQHSSTRHIAATVVLCLGTALLPTSAQADIPDPLAMAEAVQTRLAAGVPDL